MSTKRTRILLITATAAAVALLIGGMILDRAGRDGAPAPAEAGAPASSSPGESKDPSGSENSSSAEDAEDDPLATDGPNSEVLPPLPTPTGLPSPVDYTPIATKPLPDSHSEAGELVRGFPEAIPVMGDSSIVTSSVAVDGDRLQAALDARVAAATESVIAFYTEEFGALGLQGTSAPAVGGSTAVAFSHGSDSIVVTATPVGTGTQYTVFGTFTVAG